MPCTSPRQLIDHQLLFSDKFLFWGVSNSLVFWRLLPKAKFLVLLAIVVWINPPDAGRYPVVYHHLPKSSDTRNPHPPPTRSCRHLLLCKPSIHSRLSAPAAPFFGGRKVAGLAPAPNLTVTSNIFRVLYLKNNRMTQKCTYIAKIITR
jgi:hypothetical protein